MPGLKASVFASSEQMERALRWAWPQNRKYHFCDVYQTRGSRFYYAAYGWDYGKFTSKGKRAYRIRIIARVV
jgi:hypothetical protein